MDKEKVKNYLKNYFFPITSASQEEWRGMYRGAIEYGYLHYEGDLTEWERKRQWKEFDRLMQLERTPVVVAAAYQQALPQFLHHFKTIEFAVYCRPEDQRNYDAFTIIRNV